MKKCPHCGESIQNEAKKCRFCREWLNNEEAKDKQVIHKSTEKLNNKNLEVGYIKNFFIKYVWFSPKSRVGRLPFIIIVILFVGLAFILSLIENSNNIKLYQTLFFPINLFAIIFLIEKLIKRVHDLDISGWRLIVPIINGFLILGALILPGTPGDNKYGGKIDKKQYNKKQIINKDKS